MMTVVPERCVKVLRAVRDVDRILVAQTIWLVLITNVQIHVRIHGPAELTQNAWLWIIKYSAHVRKDYLAIPRLAAEMFQ